MKKLILTLVTLALFSLVGKSQSLTVNYAPCASSLTAVLSGTIAGTTNYTWTISPTPTGSILPWGTQLLVYGPLSNQNYTITCVAYSGATPLATYVATVNATAPNSISLSSSLSSNSICLGSSVTFTVNGGGSSTWTPTGATGSVAVFTPTAAGWYPISATSSYSNGCYLTAFSGITVVAPASLSVTSASGYMSLCNGSATLIASGASTYTWSNAAVSSVINVNSLGCYTVSGTNACGTSSTVACINTTAPTPTITATGVPSVLCSGTSMTVNASGATNYTWTGAPYGTPFVLSNSSSCAVSPTVVGQFCLNVVGSASGCASSAAFCTTVVPSSSGLVVGGQSLVCSPGTASITLYAAGAQNYTWSTGATGSLLVVPTPTANTCFTLTGSGNCIPTLSTVICVTISPQQPIGVTGSTVVCSGTGATYNFTGAYSNSVFAWPSQMLLATGIGNSYTAYTGTLGCFYASGYNYLGCPVTSNTICPVVNPTPTISIVPSSSVVCAGNAVTLTATGASGTFSWNSSALSNTSTVVVSPTVSTLYSVIVTTSLGCSASASQPIIVNPSPGAGATVYQTICSGLSATLTASNPGSIGWNTGATTNSIVVSPASSTCYTATGTNANGCSAGTLHCVNVLPSPSISITASNSNTVCLGSSVLLTATGAPFVTWSTGAVSNTISLLPSTSTLISASSTGTNSCVGSASLNLVVNPNCSDVWPGDANSDGIVGTSDLLELGLNFGATGAARGVTGNSYVSHYATNWTGTVSSGKNRVHADCNGDGTVNIADTVAIATNFGQSHAFKPGAPAVDPELKLVSVWPVAYKGIWNRVDVLLGNQNNASLSMVGLAMDISYGGSTIDADSIYVKFSNSTLTSNTQFIDLSKNLSASEVYAMSGTRTDMQNVSVSGLVASIWFKPGSLSGSGDPIQFNIQNAKYSAVGNGVTDIDGGQLALAISLETGINENTLANTFNVFPNPTSQKVFIQLSSNQESAFKIIDLTGRNVLSGSVKDKQSIDISQLPLGAYFIEIEGHGTKKLIKE